MSHDQTAANQDRRSVIVWAYGSGYYLFQGPKGVAVSMSLSGLYPDRESAESVRVPLDQGPKFRELSPVFSTIWSDPGSVAGCAFAAQLRRDGIAS